MGLSGIEPLTSRLSGVRSNQLSYRPRFSSSKTRLPYPVRVAFIICKNFFCIFSISVSSEQTTFHISLAFLPNHTNYSRKEVIQPHLPVRLPCYDLAPVTSFTLGSSFLAVRSLTLGTPGFHGLTGGVYKARERIHRIVLIHDY